MLVFAVPVPTMFGFPSLLLGWFLLGLVATGLGFCSTQPPPCEKAQLAFCCAWLPLRWGRAEVAIGRLHPGHGTRCVGRVRNFLGSVSMQQIFEMGGTSFTAWLKPEFYLVKKG